MAFYFFGLQMGSPQLENGYIRIATELWEALTKYRIPGEQMQVLMFILRKTYGWHKKSDVISYGQFVKSTGIKKSNVVRAIKELKKKKIIGVLKKEYRTYYEFNKKYTQWEGYSKESTQGTQKRVPKGTQKRVLQKIIKDTNKRYIQMPPTADTFSEKKDQLTTDEKLRLIKETKAKLKNGASGTGGNKTSLANEGG